MMIHSLVKEKRHALPPRDDPLGAKRPWARTDPRAWRRIGRVLWRSFPRGPGGSSCTCADNSARRPPRSIRASQPGSPRPTASSATGGTSFPSGTSGLKGRERPATRALVWSRSGSLGRPTRTIFSDPGTANESKRRRDYFFLVGLICVTMVFFLERGGKKEEERREGRILKETYFEFFWIFPEGEFWDWDEVKSIK